MRLRFNGWKQGLVALGVCAVMCSMATAQSEYGNSTTDSPTEGTATATDQEGVSAIGSSVEAKKVEPIRERYDNRTIKIERQVVQDAEGNYVNHGSWKFFTPNGSLIAEGRFDADRRQGTWTRVIRSAASGMFARVPFNQFKAPFLSKAVFDKGKLDGAWTITDSNKRKIVEINFVDGLRSGKASWWYVNGQKMREIDYLAGEIDGQLMQWTSKAKMVTKSVFQKGRKLGRKVANYGANHKKSDGVYLFAKIITKTPDDWWNDRFAVYSRQGKDQRHGAWTSWHENGQMKEMGEFKNGLRVGKFTWWYSNGQKSTEGEFDQGRRDSDWLWWHKNGQKSTQGQYTSGNPKGRWQWWKETGKVQTSADYSEGPGVVTEQKEVPGTAARNRATDAAKRKATSKNKGRYPFQ